MAASPLLLDINPQHVILFHHFREFLAGAHDRGIDAAPLKGAHLIPRVYPPKEDRGFLADVDFLVRPSDWEAALQLLSDKGYVHRTIDKRPVSDREFHEAGYSLRVAPGQYITLEPHRYLVQRERLPLDYDALWRRSVPSDFDGVPCRRLTNDDHFLHAIVHLMSHLFITPQRTLRDMTLLLTRGDVALERILPETRRWHIVRAAWLALVLLREVAPDQVSEEQIQTLAPPSAVQRYLRWLVPDPRGFRFPKMRLRAREALLWPALFDTPERFAAFTGSYAKLRCRDAIARLKGERFEKPVPLRASTQSTPILSRPHSQPPSTLSAVGPPQTKH